MQPCAVLVVSERNNTTMAQRLSDAGMDALAPDHIESALETLRHEEVAGILISSMNAAIDILELVLNVRDVDMHVPIAVVGKHGVSRDVDALSRTMPNIHIIPDSASPSRVVNRFKKITRQYAR
jgi:DNA-binding NtrC family response regulator